MHGFLAYMARCLQEGRRYRIFGYKGKQVRDNIHAYDVCLAIKCFYEQPRSAAVYNLGGGRQNSISVLEAISLFQSLTGKKLDYEYVESNRIGDHICYISDLSKFSRDYPQWQITRSIEEIVGGLTGKRKRASVTTS